MSRTTRIAVVEIVLLLALFTWAGSAGSGLSSAVPASQQRGFAMPTWEPRGYERGDAAAALTQIAGVGGTWVQIVPTWYVSTRSATRIVATSQGPSDEDVRFAIGLAHARGLKVLLKPHVDSLDGVDRSQLAPADTAAWFASYTAFITHYATLAQATRSEEFAVGTELASMSGQRPYWAAVIAGVRKVYAGPLVYAANDWAYTRVAFWDLVDVVGIDAYWSLGPVPTADVATLRKTLEPQRDRLAAFAAQVHRRILFTEAGFASQRGATTNPSSETVSTVPAPAEQAAGYEALLETFGQEPWWAGVFWWVWADVPQDGVPASLDFSVRGKPAEAVIRRWWTPPPAE
jgi:hypothetical protein